MRYNQHFLFHFFFFVSSRAFVVILFKRSHYTMRTIYRIMRVIPKTLVCFSFHCIGSLQLNFFHVFLRSVFTSSVDLYTTCSLLLFVDASQIWSALADLTKCLGLNLQKQIIMQWILLLRNDTENKGCVLFSFYLIVTKWYSINY